MLITEESETSEQQIKCELIKEYLFDDYLKRCSHATLSERNEKPTRFRVNVLLKCFQFITADNKQHLMITRILRK